MKQILFNVTTSEKRAAIVEDGKLIEILLERPNAHPKAGNIYYGRVAKVLPGMQAAFVDIGFAQNGFIHANDVINKSAQDQSNISELIHEGQWIVVQVKKESSQSKGPLLTENITLPGENLVYLPFGTYTAVSKKLSDECAKRMKEIGDSLTIDCEGVIMRTSSQTSSIDHLKEEIAKLRHRWDAISSEVENRKKVSLLFEGNTVIERALIHTSNEQAEYIFDDFTEYKSFKHRYPSFSELAHLYKGSENLFNHHHVEQALHKALQPVVWLKNGGHINIDPTEALTVIDVNTGKFTGKQERSQTILETNLLAAEESAKQLRLRNISGMIVIDFIRMGEKDHQKQVLQRLEGLLNQDPIRTRIHGFTSLGLLELTRQKVRDSLSAQMTERCSYCKSSHSQLSVETVYYDLERTLYEYRHNDEQSIWIEVSGSLLHFIKKQDEDREDRLSSLVSAKLYMTEKSGVSHPSYQVRQIGSCEEIEARINKK